MAETKETKALKTLDYANVTLADAENMALNKKQFNYIMSPTPKEHLYERAAKGGGTWTYVKGGYVKKVLNLAFGWDWDFQVLNYEFDLNIKQAFVHGRLTIRSAGKTVIKEQFGRVEIKFKTIWDEQQRKKIPTDEPLDIGNDLKAAATDALKKCASELGICADIYAEDDFTHVKAVDEEDFDSVPMDIIRKIRAAETEEQLKAVMMARAHKNYVQHDDFQKEYNEKLQDLWQRQDQ